MALPEPHIAVDAAIVGIIDDVELEERRSLTGTVIGNVVATAHHPAYDAKKMMVVKLDDAAVGAPESIIALDQMSAGPGDRVLVMQERKWCRANFRWTWPINAVIVGIVDAVHGPSSGA